MAQHEGKTAIARVIRERRSIKANYLDHPVPQDLVLELLNDAVWAPNHGLREPWRFIFVPSENKTAFVEDLVQTFPEDAREQRRRALSEPAAFLIVVMKEDPRQKQNDENFAAVSALIQNFQLLAWEKRLGVVWKTNPFIYEPKVRELLGVQGGERIVGILHLGYFEQIPPARERTPAEEKFVVFAPKH